MSGSHSVVTPAWSQGQAGAVDRTLSRLASQWKSLGSGSRTVLLTVLLTRQDVGSLMAAREKLRRAMATPLPPAAVTLRLTLVEARALAASCGHAEAGDLEGAIGPGALRAKGYLRAAAKLREALAVAEAISRR